MSTLAPVPATDHLAAHRGLIVRGALIAGAVGLVPVPLVDEILTAFARSRLLRRLADRRQVDLDRSAVLLLCEDRQATVLRHATLAVLTLVLARYWRRLFPVVAVGRRVDEVVHTFQLATLFDHYCARHHVGAALKGAEAARLRQAIDLAQTTLPREVAARIFGRALGRAAQSLGRLPRRLRGLTGGRPPRRPSEDAIVDAVTADLDREGRLRRAVRLAEEELGAAGRSYLAELVGRFDACWRATSPAAGSTGASPRG